MAVEQNGEDAARDAGHGARDDRPAPARISSARIIDPYGGHSVMASMREGNRSQKAEDVLSESTALDAAAVPVW
jgi:hypothetical protein